MANPGTGYRSVVSLMMEMSLHLLQPIVYTPLTAPITSTGVQTASIASTTNLYAGAQLVVDTGASKEAVTVITVASSTTFTASFAFTHLVGAIVQSATFPKQALTDPLFTQSEILSYISRAQNELLAQCSCIYTLSQQTVSLGTLYQSLPTTVIQLARVASSSANIALSALARASNTVTATSVNPHGFTTSNIGKKFSIFGPVDNTFDGSFTIATVPTTSSWTYTQYAADASTTGGTAGLWVRAYEVSQEQLYLQNPVWRSNTISSIGSWYEDRTGLYAWGVNGIPGSNFPCQLLTSIRDSDSLLITDGFLVPDLILHIVKYRALEYCWEKDGEQRDPVRAKYCETRFTRGVAMIRRWLWWSEVMPDPKLVAEVSGK